MKALLRKDLNWLVTFAIIGTLVPLIAVRHYGFNKTWVIVGTYIGLLWDCYIAWWLCGISLGLVAALRDEVTRTEEYLFHRPVSAGAVFGVRTAACLVIMACWVVVPFLFSMFIPGSWHENASVAEWNRFWTYLGTGSIAFSSFSVSYSMATLRVHWFKRIMFGSTLMLALFAASLYVPYLLRDAHKASLAAYTSVHILATLVLLWIAFKNFKTRIDPDLPVDLKTVCLMGTVCSVAFILTFNLILSQWQKATHMSLTATYPDLAVSQDTDAKLVKWNNSQRGCNELDKKHGPLKGKDVISFPEDPLGFEFMDNLRIFAPQEHSLTWDYSGKNQAMLRSWFLGCEVFAFSEPWFTMAGTNWFNSFNLRPSDGLIYHHRLVRPLNSENPNISPSIKRYGKGEKHLPFSVPSWSLSRELLSKSDYEARKKLIIGDPEDGGIWYLDLERGDTFFHRIDLPEGDAFVQGIRPRNLKGGGKDEATVEIDGKSYIPAANTISYVVKGKKGVYFWNGASFEPYVDYTEKVKKVWETRFPFDVVVRDPVCPEIEMRDDDGTIRFTHQYDLCTSDEQSRGYALYGMSMLRAPIFQVMSYLWAEPYRTVNFKHTVIADPLLTSQKRLWLLAANVLVALFFAIYIVWKLNHVGAPKSRCLYWGILILVGGLGGLLLCSVLETRRAYRHAPVRDAESREPLLISSDRESRIGTVSEA